MAERFDRAFWDDRYRSRSALWSGNPNCHLMAEVEGLVPGAALDVGAGEGADAIWLAGRGWRVTAVDISGVALERAARHAAEAGEGITGRIEWLQRDITEWEPLPGEYDLVSAQYMHLPPSQRLSLFRGLAHAVVLGGTLLIVAHHSSDLHTTAGRPHMPELFYSGEEIANSLDPEAWDIITNTAVGRPATDPEGCAITVHDTVFRARRRGHA
jgi:SAM-dependent methyltransferase